MYTYLEKTCLELVEPSAGFELPAPIVFGCVRESPVGWATGVFTTGQLDEKCEGKQDVDVEATTLLLAATLRNNFGC